MTVPRWLPMLLAACVGAPSVPDGTDRVQDPDTDAVDSEPVDSEPVDSDEPDTDPGGRDDLVVTPGVTMLDRDGDGAPDRFDCADLDPAVHPGAVEVCGGVDEDCDGLVDDADPDVVVLGGRLRFLDADLDGVGAGVAVAFCAEPGEGWSTRGGDCDDLDAAAFPGAARYDDPSGCLRDLDHDGFGDVAAVAPVAAGTDCDDTRADVSPIDREVPYDGVDQDCVGGDACDVDGDGFVAAVGACGGDDCDDGARGVHLGVEERCNGFDDDCDGLRDEADPDLDRAALQLGWYDADHDGWGDAAITGWVCSVTGGDWVAFPGDCDDADAGVSPGEDEVPWDGVDQDCEGGDLCDVDADGVLAVGPCGGDDCDDLDSGTRPGVPEACDGLDRDCDGLSDPYDPDVDPSLVRTFWLDVDGDTWGDPAVVEDACGTVRAGWALSPGDCDDLDATVSPGRPEVPYNGKDDDCVDGDACDLDRDGFASVLGACGGLDCADEDPYRSPGVPEVCGHGDDDCDALVDEDDPDLDPATLVFLFLDADGDGWGDAASGRALCDPQGVTWTSRAGDCDDALRSVFPRAPEVPYDGVDQDCDGADLCDVDRDGAAGAGCGGDDCDDRDALRTPGRPEACNGRDDDCDALIDAADPSLDPASATRFWRDADLDGFGTPSLTELACASVRYGWARNDRDCDDAVAAIKPGAQEVCGGIDEDCDGLVDDADPGVVVAGLWYLDVDADGFPRAEGAVARCAPPEHGVRAGALFDCDDLADTTFPGAAEAESDVACQADADDDGWGDLDAVAPTLQGQDCDDARPDVSPDADEVCGDGVDQDCDTVDPVCPA